MEPPDKAGRGHNCPAPQPLGPWCKACAPCSPQPHERDTLLAASLNTALHLPSEQEHGDWPGDGPKPPEPYSHHKAHGRSKHPSGSNVSFSRDTEGGEEPGKVRGERGGQSLHQPQGVLPPPPEGSVWPSPAWAAGAEGTDARASVVRPPAWPGRAAS